MSLKAVVYVGGGEFRAPSKRGRPLSNDLQVWDLTLECGHHEQRTQWLPPRRARCFTCSPRPYKRGDRE